MAYVKSKKLTDADKAALNSANAVNNYGDFQASSATNKLQQDKDSAYTSLKNYGDFKASNALLKSEQNKVNAENAVNNYGNFEYALQQMYDNVMNKALNREKFSYDVTGDALYQQYKDQYINQGKLAMMDTMGQAAAMTGGYGNSYAQSVGQQAYQGYLQQLNDKVPELYQLALDKYNAEGDELRNQYAMLSDDRATKYNEWNDGYNKAVAERDYYGTDYYNRYANEYNAYTDKYNRLGDLYQIAADAYNTGWNQDYTKWESGLNQLIDQRDYNTNYASNLYNQEYGEYTDEQANNLANEQLKLQQSQYDFEALKKMYEGYMSPEDVQAYTEAANSEKIKNFNATIMTQREFQRRGKKAAINDKDRVFDSYSQYIDAVLEKWYDDGMLTENEVKYLKSQHGIQ